MAWDGEGMREVGNSMNVKPTKKESKEIARKMKMKMESDLPYTMQTRQSNRTRTARTYADDFVMDRIDLKKIMEELIGLEEIPASKDINIIDDQDKEWIDDRSKSEV